MGTHATQLCYQKKAALPLTATEMQVLLQSMTVIQTCNSSSTDPDQQMLCCKMACYLAYCGTYASGAVMLVY